ncbi:type II toxin-antitoxin system HicB family antitoxin [Aeromonas bestiarum]|nr:type II toxin-antitoxin system HicB family antitoxin [Aeromonas bestiarum]
MFSPEDYTVLIRRELIDDDMYYVAKIKELPDVAEYALTRDEALDLAYETISLSQKMFVEQGLSFPEPIRIAVPDVSGRVTLRLAKQLHADAIEMASLEGISLNQFLSNAILSSVTQVKTMEVFRHSIDGLIKAAENKLHSSYKIIEMKRLTDVPLFYVGGGIHPVVNAEFDEMAHEKITGSVRTQVGIHVQAAKRYGAADKRAKFSEDACR